MLDFKAGSRTMGSAGLASPPLWRDCRKRATAEATSGVPSMPIFMPAGGRSEQRYSSVRARNGPETGSKPSTPTVDCTVRLVMAAVPKMPCEAKVFKSAVTPAPLEGSNPAMLRAILAPAESSGFLPRMPEDGGFVAAERFADKPEADEGGLLMGKVGLRVEGALYHKAN